FADNGPGKCHPRLSKSGHRHLDVLDSDGDMMESLVAESADPFRNHAGPPAFAGIRLVDEHRRIAGLAIHLGIPILVRKSLAKTVAQLDELFRSFVNVVRAEREMVDDREKAYPDLLQTHFEDLSRVVSRDKIGDVREEKVIQLSAGGHDHSAPITACFSVTRAWQDYKAMKGQF